jgi:hypothetical protein
MSHFIHLAYIDPGTGSVILQATIGAIAGISYAIRNRVRSLFAKFGKGSKAEKPTKS